MQTATLPTTIYNPSGINGFPAPVVICSAMRTFTGIQPRGLTLNSGQKILAPKQGTGIEARRNCRKSQLLCLRRQEMDSQIPRGRDHRRQVPRTTSP